MRRHGFWIVSTLFGLVAMVASAQDTAPAKPDAAPPASPAAAAAVNPARELTVSKCFQCHADNMWRDQRLNARGWEATLYRMVARGAVWSGDDIKAMAAFLATDFGPQSPRAVPTAR